MAATWIKSLHVKKNASKISVVAAVIDYVENPGKTDGGRLITSYKCDARVADAVCYKGCFRITPLYIAWQPCHP